MLSLRLARLRLLLSLYLPRLLLGLPLLRLLLLGLLLLGLARLLLGLTLLRLLLGLLLLRLARLLLGLLLLRLARLLLGLPRLLLLLLLCNLRFACLLLLCLARLLLLCRWSLLTLFLRQARRSASLRRLGCGCGCCTRRGLRRRCGRRRAGLLLLLLDSHLRRRAHARLRAGRRDLWRGARRCLRRLAALLVAFPALTLAALGWLCRRDGLGNLRGRGLLRRSPSFDWLARAIAHAGLPVRCGRRRRHRRGRCGLRLRDNLHVWQRARRGRSRFRARILVERPAGLLRELLLPRGEIGRSRGRRTAGDHLPLEHASRNVPAL